MFTLRKTFKFEMAHQLINSYTECCHQTIHGHSYVLELFFQSFVLDPTGMVIDFGNISDLVKDYIHKTFDHALIMPESMDKEYLYCLTKYNKKIVIVDYNPTAEEMAKRIYINLKKKITVLCKVRLHETGTGYAEYYEKI